MEARKQEVGDLASLKFLVLISMFVLVVGLAGCVAQPTSSSSSASSVSADDASGSLAVSSSTQETQAGEADLSCWADDSSALAELKTFVEEAVDENSDGYIPPEARIATFDMDGTILCETAPSSFIDVTFMHYVLDNPSAFPEELQQAALNLKAKYIDGDTSIQGAYTQDQWALAYAGMSLTDFRSYVDACLEKDAEGFSGMAYKESFYRPMLQVIEYLQANEFTVYLVTGTNRVMARRVVDGVVNIPERNIIGSDVEIVATGQGSTSGGDYQFADGDILQFSGNSIITCLKMNKVALIAKEIGAQPVLAFGNTESDQSMLNYAISNNQYPSKSFLVLNDDTVREHGNTDVAEEKTELAAQNGWTTISMADDFKTIYGDNVEAVDYDLSLYEEYETQDLASAA